MSFDLTNKNISDTFQNVLQKTGSDNRLYDLTGNEVTDLRINGTLTADQYVVSSSVTSTVFQQHSGSTIFGDSVDDTHRFTGSLNLSGSINLSHTTPFKMVNSTGLSSVQMIMDSSDNLVIGNTISSKKITFNQMWGAAAMTITGSYVGEPFVGIRTINPTKPLQVTGDISQSGNFITEGHITASGNISSSGAGPHNFGGNIYVETDNYIGEKGESARIRFRSNAVSVSDGELLATEGLDVTGHITASGNISSSGDIITKTLSVGNVGNNKLNFSNGAIELASDTDVKIEFDSSGQKYNAAAGDTMHFNEAENNVDIKFGTSAGTTLFSKGNEQKIGIGGQESPAATLDITGDLKTSSHITASGNISASGTITMLTASIGGGIFTSASLAAGGGGDGGTGSFDYIKLSGDMSSSGEIYLEDEKKIYFGSPDDTDCFIHGNGATITVDGDNYVNLKADVQVAIQDGALIVNPDGGNTNAPNDMAITARGNISASGKFYPNGTGNLEVEGGISSSGVYHSNNNTSSFFGAVSASGNLYIGGNGGSATINYSQDEDTYIRFNSNQFDVYANNEQVITSTQNVCRISNPLTVNRGVSTTHGLCVEGIITASDAFFVGGVAGTFVSASEGNISASGWISASHFSGDGSGLSGVTATADPAGDDTHVQFNDGGSTGGEAGFTYNKTTDSITLAGNISASGGFKLGLEGSNNISMSNGRITATGLVHKFGSADDSELQITGSANTILTIGSDGHIGTQFQSRHNQHSFINADTETTDTSNLGIGTQAPTKKLQVEGDISASGAIHMEKSQFIYFDSPSTDFGFRVYEQAVSSAKVLMNKVGGVGGVLVMSGSNSLSYVGIGTGVNVSPPTQGLSVEGNISASGNFVLGGTSAANPHLSASMGNLELSGSGKGQIEVDYRLFDTGSATLGSAGGGMGDIVKFGGSSTTAGTVYYLKADGDWAQVDSDAGGTTSGSIAVALGSLPFNDGMLLRGVTKLSHDPGGEPGAPLYISTTAGQVTSTVQSSGDFSRVVGFNLDGSGLIYFNPDNTTIKVA